jgi:hypothetical protein
MSWLDIYTIILSLATVSGHIVIGNKWRYAYLYNLLCISPMWFIWMWMTNNWGFVVLQFFLIITFIRNDKKWRK